MSGINQPISIGTDDPEYYAELFRKARTSRPTLANRCLRSKERSCPDKSQEVDRRLQTLLDAVAEISLCRPGNGSATMACSKVNKGTLETRLYIVFNHKDDQLARRCPQHLQSIFEMLRQVPYKPPPAMDGSPKVIPKELENDLIEICRTIHNYSFDIFAHRVTKRERELSDMRRYIEQDRTHFTSEQHSTLMLFLLHVDAIIKTVADAQATKQLSATYIDMLLKMHSCWTKLNLLPKLEDVLADNDEDWFTLLDNAERWLVDGA
ncbi:hypothetical protein BGW80DRAFT_1460262 [Lactifluus volemus]|nr:hypothetical protein BGW80DRAFT_1460262 [Lactifluus volemus]